MKETHMNCIMFILLSLVARIFWNLKYEGFCFLFVLFYFLLPQLGEQVVIGYRDISLRRKFGGSRGSRIDQWQKEQFYAKETG